MFLLAFFHILQFTFHT